MTDPLRAALDQPPPYRGGPTYDWMSPQEAHSLGWSEAMAHLRAALAAEARPGLDADVLARAYIRVRGAHMPIADELDGDEEVRPCAWCRLAAEQHIEAVRLTEKRP